MTVWAKRTLGFQMGIAFLFVGSVMFAVGFVAPYWLHRPEDVFAGLWQSCIYLARYESDCVFNDGGGLWFQTVQVMQTAAVIGLIISWFLFAAFNCCTTTVSKGCGVEVAAFISGLLGLASVVAFATKRNATFPDVDYSWAFICDAAGCSIVLLTSGVIFYFNRFGDFPACSFSSYPNQQPRGIGWGVGWGVGIQDKRQIHGVGSQD